MYPWLGDAASDAQKVAQDVTAAAAATTAAAAAASTAISQASGLNITKPNLLWAGGAAAVGLVFSGLRGALLLGGGVGLAYYFMHKAAGPCIPASAGATVPMPSDPYRGVPPSPNGPIAGLGNMDCLSCWTR